MYRWMVARVVRWAVGCLVTGRSDLPLRMLSPTVRFRFPGTSSFAADTVGATAMTAWIRRFAALRPGYEVLDVLVGGPPWNTRVGVRLRDRIGDDYANEGMQYLTMRWGRVVSEDVFLDTERIVAWEARHADVAPIGGS